MAPPPTPPEEIAQLMRFIAGKAKNVTSPMNVSELCRQFQKETGSLVSIIGLAQRINSHRDRIHEMVEFNTDTKKDADVKVDDQQRIISYEQKDAGLRLCGKHLRISMNQRKQRDRDIIQFLVDKSKTTDKPIADRAFMREFKKKTGCTDSITTLEKRYQRVKRTIYHSFEIDMNTKIKMMFISNVKLSDETLKELREDADVEVDEEGRITKYKGYDGRLELEARNRLSTSVKSFYSDRWENICEKMDNDESEEDEKDDSNWQRAFEKKQIDLVKFLIERTKNSIYPLTIASLADDYKTEFKCSENVGTTKSRITSFRQRIPEMTQFDIHTKVKLAFVLSASIDADFLKEMRKDAIVELDGHRRIKKYEAKDGKLDLIGYHRGRPWHKVTRTTNMKATVFNDSSIFGDSEFDFSQPLASVAKGRKRAREVSEEEESLKVEDDWSMNFDTSNADDFDYDPSSYELDMDHLPIEKKPESLIDIKREEPEVQSSSNGKRYYEENFFEDDRLNYVDDHIPEEKKPESFTEVKLEIPEEPSTSNLKYHYEENMDQILFDPKPEFFK